jgi:hypothetical protein
VTQFLDEEFLIPDEDLDQFDSSSRKRLSTGFPRREIACGGSDPDSSTEIGPLSDDDFTRFGAALVRGFVYGPRTHHLSWGGP